MKKLFNDEYRNRKVLVTGHTGFKGAWLAMWLSKLGAEVIGYSLEPPTNPSLFEICKLEGKVTSIIGDVRDDEKLKGVLNTYQPEIIFHLAAQPIVRLSYIKPKDTYETNVMGTVNILEAAKNTKSVKAVVVITSDKCYENKEMIYGYRETDPMGGFDPYSSSKGCVEMVVSSYMKSFYIEKGIALASVRAGNVIGGGDWAEDRLIPDFVRSVLEDKAITIRNPIATRPWQHVLEPLSGYLWIGALMIQNREKYNGGWNFGPEDTDMLNVQEILNLSIKKWGKGKVDIDKSYQPHEANSLRLDISKAKAYLKWYPVYEIENTVKKTIEWYKTYYMHEKVDMYEYTIQQIEEYENDAKIKKLVWGE